MWQDIGKSAIGGALDLGFQYIGNQLIGKPNAKDAWERMKNAATVAYNRRMTAYKSRYQNTMEDMRAAGLNPILAASGGFQVGQVTADIPQAPMAQVPNISATNSGLNMAQMDKASQEAMKAFAEVDQVIANTSKIIEEKNLAIQNIANKRAEEKLTKVKEKETVQNVRLLARKIWTELQNFNKITQEAYYLNMQTKLTHSEIARTQGATSKIAWERRQIQKLVKKLELEMVKLQKDSNLYRGPVGQIWRGIETVLEKFGIGVILPTGGIGGR